MKKSQLVHEVHEKDFLFLVFSHLSRAVASNFLNKPTALKH